MTGNGQIHDLDLAALGNCNLGALMDRHGRISWMCLPRFDGDPVFCSLVHGNGERGFFEVEVDDFSHSEQHYRRNSAVVETRLHDRHGGIVRIVDFAPRFKQYGRVFKPLSLWREIAPMSGAPRVTVRLRPTHDYGAGVPELTRGSNHIRYVMPRQTLRLTGDGPLTYLVEEVPFVLEEPVTLVLGADESLTASVSETFREFCERTDDYWQEWCRYLSLPFEWQEAVIRAAITLKLCNFEESGAIVAAMTTSIPESPDSGRNWDYRYCWLRDAYFVVHALNRLGATRTMEGYLNYIMNIVAGAEDGYLQPVFGITLKQNLDETSVDTLAGYRDMGPVRIGNQAYKQVQNDGYGSVILACAQSFFDERLYRRGDKAFFERLEALGRQAVKRWDQPDAGLWELRNTEDVHTSSSVMCWAACDRLARIAGRLGLADRRKYWSAQAERVRSAILEQAWNEQLQSFVDTFGGTEVDASLLRLNEINFISSDDPRYLGTLRQVEQRLRRGDYVYRYAKQDDIGAPEASFNVCTFWYIDALADVGRVEEARELFTNMLAHRNHLGLLSEDIDPATGELWGNFPQTYSMVGLITSAMKLSTPWEEAF